MIVKEQGEDYIEKMREFTQEDHEVLESFAGVLVPELAGGKDVTDAVLTLVQEWNHGEVDRGVKRKEKFGTKLGVDSSRIYKWLHVDRFGQIFSYTTKGVIRYKKDKVGETRTGDWLKKVDYERRVETAKVRRSDKYLREQLDKAAKTYESDDKFEISGEEMLRLIKVIRSMEDLTEKEFL